MKISKSAIPIILLAGFAACGTAWAHGGFHGHAGHGFHHHGHGHSGASVGIAIGVPLAAPWYYRAPSPYYYYPPLAVAPATPPVYIERQDEESSIESRAGYWYYCGNPQGYYPYVQQCNVTWQQVPARPPGS